MKRRIAAILAGDMVGYSRLVELDESDTLARQRKLMRELIDPTIKRMNGHIVKLTGDGMIVEFGSVVEAVQCAVAIQKEMLTREENQPDDRRIQYRIAVNLGDVVFENDDVFGDGVNIAARLEALAEPGGIVVSGTAFDLLKNHVDVGYRPLGEKQLKNIAAPVRVYQVIEERTPLKAPVKRHRRVGLFAGAAMLLLLLLATGWFLKQAYWEPANPGEFTLPLPDKPSIAVLPFQDLSQNDPQEWFGDGMAEDIITDLSKLSGLFVISRNSSFQFRGDGHDLRQVGRDLGVAFLLEGSVRRAGDTLRINAQLIDAATGAHLWADRYDGNASDVFALQDRVTEHVVNSLALALSPAEAKGLATPKSVNLAAHDAYLQGLNHLHRREPEDFAQAKGWLDKALELDPTYAEALGARANLYMEAIQRDWGPAVGILNEPQARAALRAALEHPSALAHATEAEVLLLGADITGALLAVEKGIALDPNDIDLQLVSARVQAALGNHAAAIALVERAIRLDPLNPENYQYELGRMKHIAGDLQGALVAMNRAQTHNPNDFFVQVVRAPILAELGRLEEAAADLAVANNNWYKFLSLEPTASNIAWYWGRDIGTSYVQRLTRAYLAAGARAMPDGLVLLPENRLDYEAIIAAIGTGKRFMGKTASGLEWTTDLTQDGHATTYLNGLVSHTSTHLIRADGWTEIREHDQFKRSRFCQSYRNPSGSNETFDAYIQVCLRSTFPFGVFPLPE